MADRVDTNTRHRIMASNRSVDTGPEIEVRKALHAKGFRYRLHVKTLPGRPDLVLRSHRVAIFVHGCYWHGHKCSRQPESKSNKNFWMNKIRGNRSRDMHVRALLLDKGWRVLVIWECAVRRRVPPFGESSALTQIADWVHGNGRFAILTEAVFEECL